MTTPQPLWAPSAWLDGRWQDAVLLRADASGRWAEITPGVPAPADATRLPGAVLPPLVDAHSHAFQRAFVGLAERRSGDHDDFWSWRDRMYGVALRISPDQLRAVAAQLYTELLAGGYTQVCEFHYLHHGEDGRPYADALAMSRALAEAAAATGMGLTLLPVLYERAGFAQPALRPDQRRFASDVDTVLALRDGVRALGLPQVSAGIAIHSLRAAAPASMHRLIKGLGDDPGPIHIHIAEQTAEVDDCQAATGSRPIAWLAREFELDARWQLVHATHAEPDEIAAVAACGAGIVLCPSTEANLGDGLADLPRWLASTTPLSIGSDSQVGRAWPEELRWLEYGQRLLLRRRNVAADPARAEGATAARLFDRVRVGGAAAAGFRNWGLQIGARADLLVLDEAASGLEGLPASHRLDGLVFATAAPAFAEVWVAGRRVIAGGAAAEGGSRRAACVQALRQLAR
ncbi:Formiminoglutamic iminohydrolase [Rubrivivax sp. A210]|uniref:formimidoylglutamate deiminase n=1 Tax=Rubrivivax sp. A210 TaxID=2772301 RepID=UPI0019181186|nr:formimidoylglutamate deiminase [Rubrivivax sp. A210]CAD5372003.1 Formiminoglutamic iminohydrolase [Rubrivivax sp. A210]